MNNAINESLTMLYGRSPQSSTGWKYRHPIYGEVEMISIFGDGDICHVQEVTARPEYAKTDRIRHAVSWADLICLCDDANCIAARNGTVNWSVVLP